MFQAGTLRLAAGLGKFKGFNDDPVESFLSIMTIPLRDEHRQISKGRTRVFKSLWFYHMSFEPVKRQISAQELTVPPVVQAGREAI